MSAFPSSSSNEGLEPEVPSVPSFYNPNNVLPRQPSETYTQVAKTRNLYPQPDRLGTIALRLIIVGIVLTLLTLAVTFAAILFILPTMSMDAARTFIVAGSIWSLGLIVYLVISHPVAYILSIIGIFKRKTPNGAPIRRVKSWIVFIWCSLGVILSVLQATLFSDRIPQLNLPIQ